MKIATPPSACLTCSTYQASWMLQRHLTVWNSSRKLEHEQAVAASFRLVTLLSLIWKLLERLVLLCLTRLREQP